MQPSPEPGRNASGLPRRTLVLAMGLAPFAGAASSAGAQEAEGGVQFSTSVSEAGFTHPGIDLTEPILKNVRDQIAAGAEPWTSSFEALKLSAEAADDVTSSNRSEDDPTKPASDAFDSQGFNGRFIADGLKSYTQIVMWALTGEEVYRQNAIDIIRIWEQMDPAKYVYFTDSHIHTGIPLHRMLIAAEILRYSSGQDDASKWTEDDTKALSENLIKPSIATFMSSPDRFMNQHSYPLLGSMAGAIFMDDRALYEEKVEWFTVNSTAKDQGFNGSISRLFRWVDKNDKTGEPIADPHVQHIEMGRDQAHGGGDLTNAVMLSRMLLAQGTKVDSVDGTASTAEDAVGPYEFLGDRILDAADYFWQFMLGYDTEWTPVAYAISPDGTIRDTYNHLSNGYRGRFATASFWEIYYHYKFTLGEDVEAMAPNFAEAYGKRCGPRYYYGGSINDAWGGPDGGGDSWLFAPAEAAGEAVPALAASGTILEVEDRYTHLAGEVEDGDGYVRMHPGAEISYLSGSSEQELLGFRVRTDGEAELHFGYPIDRTVIVPDTGGEWRYVLLDETIGDIVFIESSGATLDLDHINTNAAAELTPPSFDKAAPDRVVGWADGTVTADLAATGPDGMTYSATGLPDGAELDAGTGKLTWSPAETGAATVTIAATDGTSAAARRLTLAAADDRDGAMALAEDGYDAEAGYESATEAAYNAARDRAEEQGENGTDAEYADALAELVAAVDGLRLLSPKTDVDGSLDYPGLLAASTAEESTPNLVDGDHHSGLGYGLAVDLSHTFDFGENFRVSATEFGFQGNIFSDRIATTAVFGSNDGTEWTRLTPGEADYTQDFNTEAVAEDLQGEQFRYIKAQLMDPQPDVLYGEVVGLFEMNEFHIWGERHEVGA